jgi:TetR/AcrR family transcriptional repressor of nem operon
MSKGEKTRQSIIEKAAPIFNVKGIAATSVEEVLHSAKVTRGCLYSHFETKEELATTCVDYLLQTASDNVEQEVSRHATAKAKIFAFMDISKNPLKPTFDGGCPVANLSTEVDDTLPAVNKRLKKHIDHHIDFLMEVLEEGIRAGEFSDTLVSEEYAMKLFTAMEGANMISRVKNSNKPMNLVIKGLKKELEFYCK